MVSVTILGHCLLQVTNDSGDDGDGQKPDSGPDFKLRHSRRDLTGLQRACPHGFQDH